MIGVGNWYAVKDGEVGYVGEVTMNIKRAIKLADEALAKQQRRYSVEAFMFKRGIVTEYTAAVNKKYDEIVEARAALQQLLKMTS